jgi:hypothetical protein
MLNAMTCAVVLAGGIALLQGCSRPETPRESTLTRAGSQLPSARQGIDFSPVDCTGFRVYSNETIDGKDRAAQVTETPAVEPHELPVLLLAAVSRLANGDHLKVTGPMGYHGTAKVVRSGRSSFSLELRMPAQRVLFKSMPETKIILTLRGSVTEQTVTGDIAINSIEDQDVVFQMEAAAESTDICLRPERDLQSKSLRSLTLTPLTDERLNIAVDLDGTRRDLVLCRESPATNK